MLEYIHPKKLYIYSKDLYKYRTTIFELAKKDFKARFLGSYLGILWAFINPIVTILILWFLFQIGFKARNIGNYPFSLWLLCGMIPWFFFSESLTNATGSIIDHDYLVKEFVFPVGILPMIKILSSLFVHFFFILLLVIILFFYKITYTINNIQIFYYLFATVIFVLGLSWITSSLVIFIKDISQIVAIILQFGFWITPIFWTLEMLPTRYGFFFSLNPLYYITNGYRESFLSKQWFWEDPWHTLFFWIVTFVIWVIGAIIFKKLRPHFADVL